MDKRSLGGVGKRFLGLAAIASARLPGETFCIGASPLMKREAVLQSAQRGAGP
jgi:hypothetical protein